MPRKEKIGKVVSNKMDKTIVVRVDEQRPHEKYGKFQTSTNKFKAHDAENTCNMGDTVRINNTFNSLRVFGGVKGKISNNSELNVEIAYENVARMPLFIVRNDSLRTYGVAYDDVTVLSVKPEFQLSVAEKIRLYLFGKLSSYKTTDEDEAWLLPTAWFRVGGSYNISDKVILKAEIEGTNQRIAKELGKTSQTFSTINLNGFVDANLGVDYRVSNRFHVWLNLNNIAGKQYQWYYRYPNYSFMALGGLALSF